MWGKKKKENDTTTIKRTTKIKQSYTVPSSNLNPEVIVSTGSNIKEEPVNTLNPSQTSNLFGQNINAQAERTKDQKRKSRVSSSSSEKEKTKWMGSSLGNPNNYGLIIQDAPVVQSNAPRTLNQNRGYNSTLQRESFEGVHLGKNLYGETGYATLYYMMQQPFPGQTIYVEKWKEYIPEHTRNKFLRSSYQQNHQEQTHGTQKQSFFNRITSLGHKIMNPARQNHLMTAQHQNNQSFLAGQNYQQPQSNKMVFQQRLPFSPSKQTTQKVNFQSNLQSPTKQSMQIPVQSSLTGNEKMMKGDNLIVIKQKNNINENYIVPASNMNQYTNAPTRDTDMQYRTTFQDKNADWQYSQRPVGTSSTGQNQFQQTTQNAQYVQNYDPKYSTQSNRASQVNASNLEKNVDTKGSTFIKQTTKIKESYHIPQQNFKSKNFDIIAPTSTLNQTTLNQNNPKFTQQTPNVSVQNPNLSNQESNLAQQRASSPSQAIQHADYGKSGETKNLQYLQTKYGQSDYQMADNSYGSANMQNQGQFGNVNMTSDVRHNASSMGQPVMIQPGYATTSTKVSGVDEWGRSINTYKRRQGEEFGVDYGVGLGKNLYGETGHVSMEYTIQQPFPGQTVYVPQSPDKISKATKQRFSQHQIM